MSCRFAATRPDVKYMTVRGVMAIRSTSRNAADSFPPIEWTVDMDASIVCGNAARKRGLLIAHQFHVLDDLDEFALGLDQRLTVLGLHVAFDEIMRPGGVHHDVEEIPDLAELVER